MTLDELVRSYAGKDVTALLNTGNRGDELIHEGGRELFKKYSVNAREILFKDDASGDTLFVYGAGAFCRPFHHNVERVAYYLDRFSKVVILPSTFDISYEPVRQFVITLPDKVHIFAREERSFSDLKRTARRKENINLDKDLAFFADISRYKKEGRGVLVSFRYDSEKHDRTLLGRFRRSHKYIVSYCLKRFEREMPADVFDIAKGKETECDQMLEGLSSYSQVHTDRIHVAIASAMLGKRVYLYPSFYHKVRSMYDYSLASYPNVKWAGLWGSL